MANKRSFTRFVEQELGKFPHFVVCAILEWVLIILLFIDGFVAFLANEFAKFFELRVPCLFCTRIDHVLVHKNADFYYNNSICEGHKKDISSLAYCHNHKKLSDIRKMCEVCLLSFATERESDCNTYKSLVGILHKDLECFVDDDNRQVVSLPMAKREEDVLVEMVEMEGDYCCCSCCGEPLKVKSSNSKGKNGSTFSHAPTPSPRAAFAASRNDEKTGLELPHVRYTELKLLSDGESEFVEDDEGIHGRNLDAHPFKEDGKAVKVPLLPETEDGHETSRTPVFGRGNKFFGIPLTDSAQNSPRWAIRISRKSPLERTDLSADTYEADMLGPGDNDSILNCLKRQVRIDRKSLMELYMELDEERSASAVAANNAMAMITRLQAEKAAVQMEALQYQRMMEEQAEYDQEALQATNDVLAKREEEIKALEAELDAYREKYGYLEGSFKMSEDEISDEDYQEFKSQSYLSSDEKSECSTPFSINGRDNNKENFNNLDTMTNIPSALKIKITPENSKEESTNNHDHEVALPSFQGKVENHDHGVTLRSFQGKAENDDHGVALPSFQGKAENDDHGVVLPSVQGKTENHDHGIALPSFQGRTENHDHGVVVSSFQGKVENHDHEVELPSFQGKAENDDHEVVLSSFQGKAENDDHGVALPSFQGKAENDDHGVALPSFQGKAENDDHGVALPSFQGKIENDDHGEDVPSFQGRAENDDHEVAVSSFQGRAENDDHAVVVPSFQGKAENDDHGVALPSSFQGKAKNDDHGVALPSFQGKAENDDHGVALPSFQGKTENDDHGVALPSFQGKVENDDHGVVLSSFQGKAENDDHEVVLPSFQGRADNDDHEVALPSFQRKAENDDYEVVLPKAENHGVALSSFRSYPIQRKAEIRDPEVALLSFQGKAENHDHGVTPPSFQVKAEVEDKNEPLFIGDKTYLLGRLKRAKRNTLSIDGVSSLQSSSGSVNQVDEQTGKGRPSALTRELSHLNEIVRALEAHDESSEQEGNRVLAEISNNLRKLNNLVDENSDS